jgi:hypothetical protein
MNRGRRAAEPAPGAQLLPPPGRGRSAHVSVPTTGGHGAPYAAPLACAVARPPHPGPPRAVPPCRFRGWANPIPLFVAGAASAAVASIAAPEPAWAVCSVLSHHPCTPYFGSVFRRHPFTPYSCGVFSGPDCTPELLIPLNQVPLLKVEGHAGPPEPVDRDHPVGQLNELGPLLSKCLELPPEDDAQAGMRLSLKFAFKRDGELVADPRFTYVTHEAPEKVKAAYQAAALDMLKRCTPLPITDKFGSAIAGRPFVVAIKENRALKAGDRPDDATPAPPGEPKP